MPPSVRRSGRERKTASKGRINRSHANRGSAVDETSLAITFIVFAFLTLFTLKWLGREDD
jgi:hypothetical protein